MLKHICLFVIVSCTSMLFCEDRVAVSDKDFPKKPFQLQKAPSTMPRGRAVVLLPSEKDMVGDTAGMRGVVISKKLDFPGNENELRSKLMPIFFERPVGMGMIEELKATIQQFYQKRGYPFVLVELPEQDISDGVIQLVVLEGRLGAVSVKGTRWSRPLRLKRAVSLPKSKPIDEDALAYDLYYINRNMFRQANVIYKPGDQTNDVDVVLAMTERRPFRVYVGADNTGVETTGEERLYTGFNWGDAFGLAHVLSYQYTTAFDFHDFQAHTVQYLAPLPWKHVLDLYGGYSTVNADLPFTFNDNGFSLQASARYLIPFGVTRFLENDWVFGFDFKRTNNTFEFTSQPGISSRGDNVNLTQFVLGVAGTYRKNLSRIDYSSTIYVSPGRWVADQSDDDYESLRPGAENQWIYWRGRFVYLQQLKSRWFLWLSTQGQISSTSLLPSEQFGLGGYDTVRGYEERIVNKDQAALVNFEVRTPQIPIFTKDRDGLQFLAFYDFGWGTNIDSIAGEPNSQYLMGIGPGMRYTWGSGFTGFFDWGIKLHHAQEFSHQFSRIHFGVTLSY